jgi:predicted transcriptional regulator
MSATQPAVIVSGENQQLVEAVRALLPLDDRDTLVRVAKTAGVPLSTVYRFIHGRHVTRPNVFAALRLAVMPGTTLAIVRNV